MYNLRQGPTERTEEFVSRVKAQGERGGATEQQVKFACLGGLRDEVRGVVLQHDLGPIEDIIKWASIQEGVPKDSAPQVVEMKEMMKTVLDAVQRMSKGDVGMIRGQGQRRVRFEGGEEEEEYRRPSSRRPSLVEDVDERPWTPGSRGNRTGATSAMRGRGRAWVNSGRGRGNQGWGGSSFAPQIDYEGYNQMYNNPVPQNQPVSNFANFNANVQACGNCGSMHRGRQCPAIGRSCFRCGRRNHFSSMCRSAPSNRRD